MRYCQRIRSLRPEAFFCLEYPNPESEKAEKASVSWKATAADGSPSSSNVLLMYESNAQKRTLKLTLALKLGESDKSGSGPTSERA